MHKNTNDIQRHGCIHIGRIFFVGVKYYLRALGMRSCVIIFKMIFDDCLEPLLQVLCFDALRVLTSIAVGTPLLMTPRLREVYCFRLQFRTVQFLTHLHNEGIGATISLPFPLYTRQRTTFRTHFRTSLCTGLALTLHHALVESPCAISKDHRMSSSRSNTSE